MKVFFKRSAALLSAVILMFACASCGSKKGASSGVTYDEDNLPYGATMESLKTKFDERAKVDIDFDPRYFVKEGEGYPEIYLLTDYIDAMKKKDSEAMDKLFYRADLDFKLGNDSYSKDIGGLMTELTGSSDGVADFYYAVVDTCLNENEDETLTDFDYVDNKLDELTGEKVSKTVKSRKLVYLDIYYKDGSGSTDQVNQHLGHDLSVYIYNIDGTYYLI